MKINLLIITVAYNLSSEPETTHNKQICNSFWEGNDNYIFYFQEDVPDDNIDLLLENLEKSNCLSLQNEDCGGSDRRSVLHVEHRWGDQHISCRQNIDSDQIFFVMFFSPPKPDFGGDRGIDLYIYIYTTVAYCIILVVTVLHTFKLLYGSK